MDKYFAATRIRNEKANYYHDDNDGDGGPTEHDLHISQICEYIVQIIINTSVRPKLCLTELSAALYSSVSYYG